MVERKAHTLSEVSSRPALSKSFLRFFYCTSNATGPQPIKIDTSLNFTRFFFNFSLKLCFRDAQATNSACRKLAVSLADSINLRTILSLLYTITQVLRTHTDSHLREAFQNELSKFTTVTHCLKIPQNVAFEFFNFGIFHQFLSY